MDLLLQYFVQPIMNQGILVIIIFFVVAVICKQPIARQEVCLEVEAW